LLHVHFAPKYPASGAVVVPDLNYLKRIPAMAAYQPSAAAPLSAIATYRAVSTVSNALTALAGWNDARITRKALSKLSNRELDDIGLCRGDIELLGR
jgi:uncharacterized protein YjiS (DUF1127 family)